MADCNLHKEHRERVRKQFLENGFNDSTPPHKILEMLLFYSIPRKDTNEIAHALLNRFGSIGAVLEANPRELMKIDGIGENCAVLIKLVWTISRLYGQTLGVKNFRAHSLDDIFDFLKGRYRGLTRETFHLTTLNGRNEVIAVDTLNVGDVSSVTVSSRSVLEIVIERKAVSAVLSHNHPKGSAYPSNADIEMTKRISSALAHIQVKLIDHMIFDENEDGISMAQTQKFNHLF